MKRLDSALIAAEPGEIAQLTVSTGELLGAANTAKEWSYGDQWRSVTYSPAGQRIYDEGLSNSAAYTLVNYQTRTWARQPGLGQPGLGGPAAAVPLAPGARSCAPVVAALRWLFQPRLPSQGFSASSQNVARPAPYPRRDRRS